MDVTTKRLYAITKGTKTLTEYLIPATNKHHFEVKQEGKVIYDGESYQKAKSLYEQPEQD